MAEAFVSTILEQLASLASQEVNLLWGVDDDVKKLTNNFRAIQAVLEDAESRQVKEKSVKNWLDNLRDVSYDIDDVLDEWNTAAKKLQLKEAENASKLWKKVCCCISSLSYCSRQVPLRHDIAFQIKNLNETLGVIAMEKNSFNFSLTTGTRQLEREITTSFIDVLEVYGRNDDKNKLINLLMSESSQGPALPTIFIVGMGGIGKTTLARLAFNDNRVDTYFDKKIWVCVSNPFDEIRIAKAILESLKSHKPNLDELENLLKEIGQSIKEKKILLVLDDVWIEDSRKWEPLKNSLECASQGSRILVTTRKDITAKILKATNMIPLGKLPEEESWSLFSQLAFYGKTSKECENFQDIGRKIVGKCNGLPLAIKSLGSLLSLKNKLNNGKTS